MSPPKFTYSGRRPYIYIYVALRNFSFNERIPAYSSMLGTEILLMPELDCSLVPCCNYNGGYVRGLISDGGRGLSTSRDLVEHVMVISSCEWSLISQISQT